MKLSKLVLVGLLLFTFACNDDELTSVNETLVTSKLKSGNDAASLVNLMNFAGFSKAASYIEHGVNYYEITYKTNYKGQVIIASGLVTFPDTEKTVPMLSFHNGTETKHANAPTLNSDFTSLSSIAGAGYIFVVPDYIGFGTSSDVFHPYYVKDLMAGSIVDMLKAAKELAVQEGYNFDGRVFLSGYSEGGYATMAAHKEMEENTVDGLELVASAPSSGGYDIKGMQEYFFSQVEYANPYYMAYVAMSYQTTYDWSSTMTTFFQEPYATGIPNYFDGSLSGGEINAKLTTTVANFVQPSFLNEVDTNSDFAEIVSAFEENSLHNWMPTKTMYMYHGTADITVPYQNSVDTYDNMIQLGADPNTITFINIEGATHSTGFTPYLIDVIDRFEVLK